jgi:hypothetical protein
MSAAAPLEKAALGPHRANVMKSTQLPQRILPWHSARSYTFVTVATVSLWWSMIAVLLSLAGN